MGGAIAECVRRIRLPTVGRGEGKYIHFAFVLSDGQIVSSGQNRKLQGELVMPWMRGFHSLHAEVDALRKLSKRRARGADLFVVGYRPSGEPLLSRPCTRCQAVIRGYGILRVYYTDAEGRVCEDKS